ncbi:MAG: DJ-1/PfpI family protein [Candidatus Kariarchaeaceae archaeon]|jgi:transcriptional regulator GlxA family with amidase domain
MNIGVLIWDGAEVLDFCGPFEVFNNVKLFVEDAKKPNVFIIAEENHPINAQGLSINPSYSIIDCPPLHTLLVPGGASAEIVKNEKIVQWVAKQSNEVEYLLSVCTGALVFAKANLLDNLVVTTHYSALDTLKELSPDARIDSSQRFHDNDHILTSAGISAGIDMSLHMVSKVWGEEIALKVTKYMEYFWKKN